MNNKTILEEAKNLVEELEEAKKKLQIISKENVFMKKIIAEKNNKLLNQKDKIEEITRILILSDKMLSEMKEKIYSKDEKIMRLSEKIQKIADNKKDYFSEIKKIFDDREEQIKKIIKQKEDAQARADQLMKAYEYAKKQIKYLYEKLKEASENARDYEDKKALKMLEKELETRDNKIAAFDDVFKKSQYKVKYLEEMNRKLAVQHEQEKEVMKLMLKKREEEISNLKEVILEAAPKKEEVKKEKNVVINFPKSIDPFEKKELESMIKIALDHGDSIENIKESLLTAGYKKEKINEIISFRYA